MLKCSDFAIVAIAMEEVNPLPSKDMVETYVRIYGLESKIRGFHCPEVIKETIRKWRMEGIIAK